MNIKDLEDFRLSDAVEFHDTLNPLLFTDEHLQDDVREQLMLIAEDFVEFMGIDNLKVADVRLYGSNAAYTYTKHSDIDLHILVDMSDINDDAIYRELFNSKKKLYNDSLDITVRDMPVELYMQDSKDQVKSLGDYSVMNDRWVKLPKKAKASFEEASVKEKFKKLVILSELALRSGDIKMIDSLLDTIRRYRSAGLEQGGEFSPENLAYKSLRSKNIVDKLYRHRDRLHSEDLSIDEDYDANGPPPGPEFKPTMPAGTVKVDVSDVYDWYKLGQHISNLDGLGAHDFGSGPPSTIMAFGSEDQEHKYIDALKKTGLDTTDIDPFDPKQPRGMKRQKVDTTYNVNESIESRLKKELKQFMESGNWKFTNSNLTGYQIEQAYWKRQSRLRQENKAIDFQPQSFINTYVERVRTNTLWESVEIDEIKDFQKFLLTLDLRSTINLRIGSKISVLQFTPLTAHNIIQVNGFLNPKTVGNIDRTSDGDINWIEFTDGSTFPDKEFIHDGKGGEWEGVSTLFFNNRTEANHALTQAELHGANGWTFGEAMIDDTINESSGYIPTQAERNDPRFKTALSVDVDPNIMSRQANVMGLGKISRDGRPQQLKASGKFTR